MKKIWNVFVKLGNHFPEFRQVKRSLQTKLYKTTKPSWQKWRGGSLKWVGHPKLTGFHTPQTNMEKKLYWLDGKIAAPIFFLLRPLGFVGFLQGMFQSSGLWQLKSINLENQLLLISSNFTPKTSHSCLKKWYTRFSRNEFSQRVENAPFWSKTGCSDQVFVELCILTQKLEKVKHETMKEMIFRKSPGLETCPTSGKEWLHNQGTFVKIKWINHLTTIAK